MEGEKEQGRHEGVQWKRLVNIICFIDLTVKACRLSFMLLWLAPLKIQQLQIKNDFLKNLSILIYFFYFYLLPTTSGFACIIVKVSHISSSLWAAIMVGLCSVVLSLPKRSMALKRARLSSTGQKWSIQMQGLINVLSGKKAYVPAWLGVYSSAATNDYFHDRLICQLFSRLIV